MSLRLETILDAPLGRGQKAFPPALWDVPVGEIGSRGLNLRAGDLLLPTLVLREEALAHNIEEMAAWSRRHGVSLAPHGKTSMAPQLLDRQLEAGAWGITAATVSQAAIMRSFGVPRVLIANQVVDAAGIAWLASVLNDDPSFELLCLVDSAAGAALLEAALAAHGAARPLPVLVELGVEGRRTGLRDDEEAWSVAAQIAAADHLALAGVECFEGVIGPGAGADAVAQVDALCERVAALASRLDAAGHFGNAPEVILSAGGSVFFDRVASLAERARLSRPSRVVLRSGCYLTHDDGIYDELSPLGSAGTATDRLRPALELWGAVLSRPEPELAVLGFGKRDAPFDAGLPVARRLLGEVADTALEPGQLELQALNDQHAIARVDAELPLGPGDHVVFGVSHPCTAFDKWSLLPVVNEEDDVIGAVRTLF